MTVPDVDSKPVERRESVVIEKQGKNEHQERIVQDVGAEKRMLNYRITRFIYLVFAILESLFGLRLLFKIIGANPNNLFAHTLYRFTDLFLSPFAGLISNPASGKIILEVTTIVAMLIYLLAGWVLIQLVWLIFYRARTRTVTTVDRQQQ